MMEYTEWMQQGASEASPPACNIIMEPSCKLLAGINLMVKIVILHYNYIGVDL